METEVSRRMWADLKTVQPTLIADPTDEQWGGGMENPVNSVQWNEVILFANLLSKQNGFTPCFYEDEGFTIPVDHTNYTEMPSCDFANKVENGRYPLSAVFPEEGESFYVQLRFVRYALMGWWISHGAPWLFTRTRLTPIVKAA